MPKPYIIFPVKGEGEKERERELEDRAKLRENTQVITFISFPSIGLGVVD